MTRFIQYQSVPLVIKAIPWRRIDWHGYRYFYSDIFDVISKMIEIAMVRSSAYWRDNLFKGQGQRDKGLVGGYRQHDGGDGGGGGGGGRTCSIFMKENY